MAILLQYNAEDAYAVQQLTDSTQIKMVPERLLRLVGRTEGGWGEGLKWELPYGYEDALVQDLNTWF